MLRLQPLLLIVSKLILLSSVYFYEYFDKASSETIEIDHTDQETSFICLHPTRPATQRLYSLQSGHTLSARIYRQQPYGTTLRYAQGSIEYERIIRYPDRPRSNCRARLFL